MLLEMLLAFVYIGLHNIDFLCRNETHRKIANDFSPCLIHLFQNGVDFFQNGVDFLKNLVDFFQNVNAIFSCGADFLGSVAPVAFSVALTLKEYAPVSTLLSVDYLRQ